MSDVTTTTTARRYRPKSRPDITVGGKIWKPRAKLAEQFGFVDRTAARQNWRTMYVGGVAYCSEEDALTDMVSQARRRNEPTKRRAGQHP